MPRGPCGPGVSAGPSPVMGAPWLPGWGRGGWPHGGLWPGTAPGVSGLGLLGACEAGPGFGVGSPSPPPTEADLLGALLGLRCPEPEALAGLGPPCQLPSEFLMTQLGGGFALASCRLAASAPSPVPPQVLVGGRGGLRSVNSPTPALPFLPASSVLATQGVPWGFPRGLRSPGQAEALEQWAAGSGLEGVWRWGGAGWSWAAFQVANGFSRPSFPHTRHISSLPPSGKAGVIRAGPWKTGRAVTWTSWACGWGTGVWVTSVSPRASAGGGSG